MSRIVDLRWPAELERRHGGVAAHLHDSGAMDDDLRRVRDRLRS